MIPPAQGFDMRLPLSLQAFFFFFEEQPGHLHIRQQVPPLPYVFLHVDPCLFV